MEHCNEGITRSRLGLLGTLGLAAKAEAVVNDFTRTAATTSNFPDATYRDAVSCSSIGCVGPNSVIVIGIPPSVHLPPAGYGSKVQGEGTTETLAATPELLDAGIAVPQTAKFTLAHDGLLKITYAFHGLANVNLLNSLTLNGTLVGTNLLGVSILGGTAFTYETTMAAAGSYTAVFTSLAGVDVISGQAVTVVTPIPAALPLLGSALLGFCGVAAWRRRRGADDDAGHRDAVAA